MRHLIPALLAALITLASAQPCTASEQSATLAAALEAAGDNHAELERAIAEVPPAQRGSMEFLIAHMPRGDLRTLTADRLLEEVALAHSALERAPWADAIPEGVFRNAILPYANVSEPRDPWRADFARRFAPLVEGATTSGEAALILNREVFPALKVKYSTKRKRADQSPAESIEQGKASCTGLSIILINACRSVGVPARLVGVPRWWNERGNHTWVEIYDTADAEWHFLGAAEPSAKGLDHAWFVADASKADATDQMKAIYAVTWEDTGVTLPMVWARDADPVNAVNVTARYAKDEEAGSNDKVRVGVRARLKETGERVAVFVDLQRDPLNPQPAQLTRDESADLNDLLSLSVSRGREVTIDAVGIERRTVVADDDETIVNLVFDVEGYAANRLLHRAARHQFAGADGGSLPPLDIGLMATHGEALRRAAGSILPPLAAFDEELQGDLRSARVTTATHESPYTLKDVGDKPEAGWPLVIAMHGGGGAPQEVNDSQWRHMQVYYKDHPEAGGYLYCALRAPTNEWNGFYTDYVYPLIDKLIRQLTIAHNVDTNRVYLIGYSHGGYGAFAIGPKMPDRFAAVHASAAAPTDGQTAPDNLRNLRFTSMIGENDTAYGRIGRCRKFAQQIAELRAEHPGDYPVELWVKGGFGHGGLPDRDLLPQLLAHARNPTPRNLTWVQTDTVINHHYWLEDATPAKGRSIEATRHDNVITLTSTTIDRITLNLDERHIDLTKPVIVRANGTETTLTPKPSLNDLAESIIERGDEHLACVWSVEVELPGTDQD